VFSDRYTYFPPVSCNPEDEDDAPWCTLPAFYGTGLPGRTVPLFPVDDPFQSQESVTDDGHTKDVVLGVPGRR